MLNLNIWASFAMLAAMSVTAPVAFAGANWPAKSYNVSEGDLLTIRDAPSSKAREIGKVENNTFFALSGWCRDSKAGRDFRIGEEMSKHFAKSRALAIKAVAKRMAEPNVWCHITGVGSEPGSTMIIDGWARGGFILPK